VFDIDLVDDKAFNNVFFNNFSIEPNFYIQEFSNFKNCFTLQVFYKITDLKLTDEFVQNIYKKLSFFFGADPFYQIKTGIHKNPMLEKYEFIEQKEKQELEKKDYVGFIHNNSYDTKTLTNIISIIELFQEPQEQEIKPMTQSYTTSKTKQPQAQKDPLIDLDSSNINIGQRNCFIFDKVRFFARYSEDKTFNNLLDYAKRTNKKLKNPLPDAEIKATVKSVFNYIHNKNKELSNKTGAYDDKARAKSTITRGQQAKDKVYNAIVELRSKKADITLSAIKKITQQKIETIKKYLFPIMEIIEKSKGKTTNKTKIQENTTEKTKIQENTTEKTKIQENTTEKTKISIFKNVANCNATPLMGSVP
jgi:hypothetical protein